MKILNTMLGRQAIAAALVLSLAIPMSVGAFAEEPAAAAAADVAVYPTKKYWANPACATKGVVLVGFSSIAEADIRPGIAALARAWFG